MNHRFFLKDPSPQIIVCFDAYGLHGGLADRLKGIISAYHLAVKYNYQFKIHFTHPFELSSYLEQNTINWKADQNDLTWNIFSAIFIDAKDQQSSVTALIHKVQKQKQKIFLYTNLDFLAQLYPSANLSELWKQTYHRLFQPTCLLKTALDKKKKQLRFADTSVGFHTRFATLLGDFEDVTERWMEPDAYEEFMLCVWNKMKEVHLLQYMKQAIVFSDSKRFINFVSQKINVEPGVNMIVASVNPVHSDYSGNAAESYLQTFIDFYLLANTQRVILFKTGKMYASAFSEYAATLAGIPFQVIEF